MISLYFLTLGFTLYNTVRFVFGQQRYKNWLITVFYVLSIFVLTFRLAYYFEVNKFFALYD